MKPRAETVELCCHHHHPNVPNGRQRGWDSNDSSPNAQRENPPGHEGRVHCEVHHFQTQWGKTRRDALHPRAQPEQKRSHRAGISGATFQHRSDRRPRKQLYRPERLESIGRQVLCEIRGHHSARHTGYDINKSFEDLFLSYHLCYNNILLKGI